MTSARVLLTLLFTGIFFGIVAMVCLVWLVLQPIEPSSVVMQQFVIPKGQSITAIGNRLAEAGLIRDGLVFRGVVMQRGLSNKIQAGSFKISPSMSVVEIAESLTQGTEDLWITILEGWRAEEIAQYLDSQELEAFNSAEFMSLVSQQNTEGQLFPDTYLVPRQISTQELHSLLTNTFETKVIDELQEEISTSERSFDQILVMASLVEREAREFDQMQHVAGILWNRIELGMPLQVDATLQYVTGAKSGTTNWWSPPLSTDKELVSPYNTYKNAGLPPGPIANPSVNAVKAALDPLRVDDVFYLHAPSGEMYFAQTLDEHNANINRYLR